MNERTKSESVVTGKHYLYTTEKKNDEKRKRKNKINKSLATRDILLLSLILFLYG